MPCRPLSTRHGSRGFSLIEVAMALGIVAFCLVAILGLMPLALGNARESKEDTRVAHLLQTLFADLQTRRGVVTGPDAVADFTSIDPAPPQEIQVYYSQEGAVLASPAAPGHFFTVTLKFQAAPAAVPNGTQVDFEIASPHSTNNATALLGPP